MRRLRCSHTKSNVDKIKYNFFVFDTETTCLEPMQKNFVFGCLYGYNYHKTFYTVEEFVKEFSKKKYKGKHMFAHNAEFDLLTLFGNIFMKIDNAAIFNGKFISATYKDITFVDSMNIYPTSVAKLGSIINLDKLDNEKVRTGSLTKNNITEQDVDYCMRDCEIVYKALLKIFEMTEAIKITLPSLAMYDFRHNYITEDIQFDELVDEFFESYYGGRTEAFYIGDCKAKVYDINSMYPKAMATAVFPDIKHLKKTTSCDIKFLNYCLEHYEGMCKVTVVHKETFFGYLPCRMEINRTTKLVFPVGEFTTTVNFNELRFAIKAGVVTIKKVFSVVYGNPIANIFTEYVEDNFNKRKATTNELERTIYKLKMNSLYGRFGMKMKFSTKYFEMVPYELITKLKEAAKYCDIKLFNSIRADCFLVTENDRAKNSFYAIPTISSYITSEARVILLKNLLANENNRVVYCDTDSIFLSGDFIGSISDRLGDFKKEDKTITQICGLKNYKYNDKEGKENIVIKGISRGSIKTATSTTGDTYETQRYYKTKASLRQSREAGAAYTSVKVVTRGTYDKREVLGDGTTRALICKGDKLINATTFIRPKLDKLINERKKAFRYNPQNIREAVMMFFVTGGKVWTEDLKSHVTGSNKKELQIYKGLHDVDGVHMDVFCDYVSEEYYTDRPIDVFQDVLLSYNNAKDMQAVLQLNKDALEQAYTKHVTEYEFEYDTPF